MDDNMRKLNGGGLIALFRRYKQFNGKNNPLSELNNYLEGKPVSEAFEAAAKEAELTKGEQR